MKGNFAAHSEQKSVELGGGVSRRILAYDKQLMTVEVSFETGAAGSVHTHPHTQCSYVLSGKFRYSIEDETVDMNPGDSITVPSGLLHGTTCLEKGVLLDIFAPMRDDFLP